MNELHKNKTVVWTLFAAFAIATLYLLGVRTLVPPEE
jgi:hypothetical protein